MESVAKEGGRLDVLVNNVGYAEQRDFATVSDEQWDASWQLNVMSYVRAIRAAVPLMREQGAGVIVNVSSITGIHGAVGNANYATAKAALIGLTKATARELASRGITCNAVAPGFVLTELTRDLAQEWQDRITEQTPLGRFGTPEEIANAVAFLASDEAAYITGQVLGVDGGLVMM